MGPLVHFLPYWTTLHRVVSHRSWRLNFAGHQTKKAMEFCGMKLCSTLSFFFGNECHSG